MFSLMTIQNEFSNIEKYNWLDFVEFQEIVCRISISGFQLQEPVEFKVFMLLDIMWQSMYDQGKWDKDQIELIRVNQTVYL